jgi:hypothetical protein
MFTALALLSFLLIMFILLMNYDIKMKNIERDKEIERLKILSNSNITNYVIEKEY